jgi:NAD+ synthase
MSGGIDSSVTAVLCSKAVKTLGLLMPCHSNTEDLKYAKIVAEKFGIETKIVDLTPVHDELMKILPDGDKIAQGNLKSRLRMITLYYFANNYNFLVAGTSNKSEIKIGYFTKYGDGGVDIEPIGDILKSHLRELARELRIPEEIIKKPPSPGLWEGHTTEGELGVSYDEIDAIIEEIETNNLEKTNPELVKKVREMIQKSGHKRKMPEICKII